MHCKKYCDLCKMFSTTMPPLAATLIGHRDKQEEQALAWRAS